MNTDNLKGNLDKLTGKVKEAVGNVTGNPELEAEGKLQQVKGAAQDSLGHAKDAGESLGESVKKFTE
jgi:uncharacterized protein YjbJ (UPF0337 family)